MVVGQQTLGVGVEAHGFKEGLGDVAAEQAVAILAEGEPENLRTREPL